jgi:hypothetical protein
MIIRIPVLPRVFRNHSPQLIILITVQTIQNHSPDVLNNRLRCRCLDGIRPVRLYGHFNRAGIDVARRADDELPPPAGARQAGVRYLDVRLAARFWEYLVGPKILRVTLILKANADERAARNVEGDPLGMQPRAALLRRSNNLEHDRSPLELTEA